MEIELLLLVRSIRISDTLYVKNCNYHSNREEPLEEPEEVSQTEWEEWVGRSRAQRGLHISWSGKFFFQDEEEDWTLDQPLVVF